MTLRIAYAPAIGLADNTPIPLPTTSPTPLPTPLPTPFNFLHLIADSSSVLTTLPTARADAVPTPPLPTPLPTPMPTPLPTPMPTPLPTLVPTP